MATIKIKQVKSRIKCPKVQKLTLDALGLKKIEPRCRTRSYSGYSWYGRESETFGFCRKVIIGLKKINYTK
jgi:hypothetical protein